MWSDLKGIEIDEQGRSAALDADAVAIDVRVRNDIVLVEYMVDELTGAQYRIANEHRTVAIGGSKYPWQGETRLRHYFRERR